MIRIYRIKQTKKGQIVVFEKNEKEISLKLDLDTVIKYNLFKGKEITLEEFECLEKQSHYYEGIQDILSYLKLNRSIYEIKKYAKKVFPGNGYEEAINYLERLGFLNDSLFITNFVYECIAKKCGRDFIESELANHQITPDLINNKIEIYTDDALEENILYHIQKIVRTFHGSKKVFKQKILNHLQLKNFSSNEIYMHMHHINQAMEEVDEIKFLKKDLDKLIDKYHNIDDFEFRNKKIIHDLIQRGYNQDVILKRMREYDL